MELEKLLRKISAYCNKEYKGNHRFAFFHDANNELQVVCIITSNNMYGFGSSKYKFLSFDTKGEMTGFINIEDELRNVYLAEVYTMTKVRSHGIAKELSHIMDYYLKSINKDYIYGIYSPQQMGEDARRGLKVDYKELDNRARRFYESIGFTVITAEMLDKLVLDKKISVFGEDFFSLCSMFVFGDRDAIVFKKFEDIDPENYYHLDSGYLIKNELEDKKVNKLIDKEKRKLDSLKDMLLSFGWNECKVDRFIEFDREYNLLNDTNYKFRNIPKDIIKKLKELSSMKGMSNEELYSSMYDIYSSMSERGIVIKR